MSERYVVVVYRSNKAAPRATRDEVATLLQETYDDCREADREGWRPAGDGCVCLDTPAEARARVRGLLQTALDAKARIVGETWTAMLLPSDSGGRMDQFLPGIAQLSDPKDVARRMLVVETGVFVKDLASD
jgi:hypothetical protein